MLYQSGRWTFHPGGQGQERAIPCGCPRWSYRSGRPQGMLLRTSDAPEYDMLGFSETIQIRFRMCYIEDTRTGVRVGGDLTTLSIWFGKHLNSVSLTVAQR